MRMNPNSINVEIDNTGDNIGQSGQMVGIQQPDGQIVMLMPSGNSPIKGNGMQTRLINISESSLMQEKLTKFMKLLLGHFIRANNI
jgi:hypothetical protein